MLSPRYGLCSNTNLEDSEEQTKAHKCGPVLDKAKSDHGHAPGQRDGCKPDARPEEACQNGSRWLRNHIGDEEDECNDRLELWLAMGASCRSVKPEGIKVRTYRSGFLVLRFSSAVMLSYSE